MANGDDASDAAAIVPDPARRPLGLVAGRPLVGVAIALIVGIAIHSVVPLIVPLWLGIATTFIALAMLSRNKPALATGLIHLATISSGVAIAQLEASHYPREHIAHFTGELRRLAQVEMRIVDPPRIYAPSFGQAYPMPPRQTTIAEVTAIRSWDDWKPASGRMLVQIAQPNPRLRQGQIVRAWGMLDRPAPAMNPGQFDWAAYYRQQRVLASLHIPHANNLVIVDERSISLTDRWRAWTRDRLASGFTERQSLDHALLRALVLGDSDPELRDVQEQFRATGTSHHLAISGMHIAVMGGVIFILARLLRASPRVAWAIALVFVIAYGVAALPSPPVVRSVLLWCVIGVAILARRGIDFLQMLALTLVAMLLYQPLDLFNAGFQLSFGIVIGLIVLTSSVARLFGGTREPQVEGGLTRWSLRAAAYIDRQIILVLASGIVAWLVSVPIIASQFTQLNPYALGGSILLAPIVFVALIGGVLKIVLSALWPALDGAWAWVAQQPMVWMRGTVDWLSRLPGTDVPMPAPPWWMIVIFYVTLVLMCVRWQRPGVRALTILTHVCALIALLVIPFQMRITQTSFAGELRVTMLAVGAGQCAVVEPPSGRVTLLDAGSLSLADPLRRAVAPFLRERGITSIDTIAVSHANSDHFSAVAELVESYGAREVLTAANFSDELAGNVLGAETLASLKRAERPPRTALPGDIVPLGTSTSLEVLWPPDERELKSNDQSLVVRLTHAGTSILFTGDIQDDAMKRLLRTPEKLRSDILVAPHHGSAEATTRAFIEAVAPKKIVASNDRTLTGKQLDFDRIAAGRDFLRTHDSGAIIIRIRSDGSYSVEPYVKKVK